MKHAAAPGRTVPLRASTAGRDVLLEGLPPVVSVSTRLVVLGSFPGAASLAAQQYYAHPRNHFWPIVGALLDEPLCSMPYTGRIARLRARGVGVWDVYAACRREGSLDTSIEDAVPNDLASLKRRAPQLVAVAHNGGESARSMRITRTLGVPVWRLPSTSPANASWSFERKLASWREAFVAAGVVGCGVNGGVEEVGARMPRRFDAKPGASCESPGR